MKRIPLVLILLLCLALLPALAEEEIAFARDRLPPDLPMPEAWSWASPGQHLVLGDAVYALYPGDAGILSWTPGDRQARLFYRWDKPESLPEGGRYDQLSGAQKAAFDGQVHHLFAWQDRLYALNRYSRRVGEISPEGVAWQQTELDLGRWLRNLNEGGWAEESGAVFQEADRLCVAYNVSDMTGLIQFDFALLSVDLSTGKALSIDTGMGQSMVPYKPGQALVLGMKQSERGYRYQLRSVDVVSGAVSDLPIDMPDYQSGDIVAGLAYDRRQDIIYYNDGSRVHLSRQGGPFEAGTVMQLGRGKGQGLVLPDGRYGAQGVGGLWLRAVSPGGAEGYLKLHLDFGAGDPVYRAYMKDHPDARVLLTEGSISAADAVTDMRRQTEPVDIYQLRVESDFSALKDKGYAASLEDDPVIREAVAAMYPFMRSALSDRDGRLVAAPAGIQIWHAAAAPQHYDVFFKGEPYPETWKEYLEQLGRFEEQSPSRPEYSFQDWMTYDALLLELMNAYIEAYERPGEPLSFDRPELSEALDLLVRARDLRVSQGQSLERRIEDTEDGVLPHSVYFPRISGVNATLYNTERTDQSELNRLERIKPLSFVKGEPPVYRAMLNAFILNPASRNREMALAFLRYAVRRETEPKYHIMMRPDDNEPVIQDNYDQMVKEAREGLDAAQAAYDQAEGEAEKTWAAWELARVRALATEPEKNKWLVSPGSIEDYRSWADQIRAFDRSPYIRQQYGDEGPVARQLQTLCARYLAGQLDQAGILRTLDDTFRLIYLEQR